MAGMNITYDYEAPPPTGADWWAFEQRGMRTCELCRYVCRFHCDGRSGFVYHCSGEPTARDRWLVFSNCDDSCMDDSIKDEMLVRWPL